MPQDRLICSLWISQPPSQEQLVQSCGTANLNPYRLDVSYNGTAICSKPASQLPTIKSDCLLTDLSAYRLNIIEPNYTRAICAVSTLTAVEPTRSEIESQCPEALKVNYQVKPWGTKKQESSSLSCKPPLVQQPASITTGENYHLLAAKLIWYGYAKADCPNGALISPTSPTPCGLSAARPAILEWQNGMDSQILETATKYNIPARAMKEIIARETQFWSWTGINGEHGIFQITEDGADLVLRMSLPGYDRMKENVKRDYRIAWLKQLDCETCTPKQAYDHAKRNMDLFGEALAAYWCTYGTWDDAIRAWNEKHGGLQ
jgi:hypothetical protein